MCTLAVLHPTLVKHLIEEFVDVMVRFFDLVEQHYAPGVATHRFRQHTTLAIAHIAGRRAFQRGNGVSLLELAHIDGYQVLLAAVDSLRQRQRGFGFTDTGRPGQHKHAHRFAWIAQSRPGGLNTFTNLRQRAVLPGNALRQSGRQFQHLAGLIFHHAPSRNTGPVGDNRRDNRRADFREHHRRVALPLP